MLHAYVPLEVISYTYHNKNWTVILLPKYSHKACSTIFWRMALDGLANVQLPENHYGNYYDSVIHFIQYFIGMGIIIVVLYILYKFRLLCI